MKDIDKFRESISRYRDRWYSIDIRTVCFLAYEKWINIGTRIMLSEKAAAEPVGQTMLPLLPNLCALNVTRDMADLDGLLDHIQAGMVAISGKTIYFGAIETNDVRIAPLSFHFQQARRGTNYFNAEYPYLSLVHSGPSLHNLLDNHEQASAQDEIDWKLRSLKAPYNGLDDLLVNFLGIPHPAYGGIQSALTEFVAPLGIRLGSKSTLSNGKLTVHVESIGGPNSDGVSLGVIALSGRSPMSRVAHDLAKDDWERKPGAAHKEISIENASSAVIFLSCNGNALDMQTVNDPAVLLKNPRILAYNHFDQNLSVLKEYLVGKGGDQSKDFEIGVGLLFHFCGFNVGPYGRVKALQSKSIQEEIDHVIFAPSGSHIVAIECTRKDLDIDGKLSKFSRRVKELRDFLPTFTVIPLVCTPLSKVMIAKSDSQKTNEEQIGVVAAEGIQTILEMAEQNKEPDEILDFLIGLIKKPDDTLFWST